MLYKLTGQLYNVMVLNAHALLFKYVETFELRCTIKLKIVLLFTVKKVSGFSVPSRGVTNKTPPGRDGKTANFFLQCVPL